MTAKKRASKKRAAGADLATIRRITLALPGVEEGTSYGTPAFRVKKRLFLRMHDGGDDLVVRLEDDLCELLLANEPRVFHKTPHYERRPYLLVRLGAITEPRLAGVIEEAWSLAAPARLAATRGR